MPKRPTLNAIVRRIHALGHAPEFPVLSESFFAWLFSDSEGLASELISRYQRFHGLPVSGRACPATVAHLQSPRCSHPDVMAVGSESRWALPSLTYYQTVAYANTPAAEVAAEYAEAVRRVAAVCGIRVSPATSPATAQIVATAGQIDGEWNVLALSELPPPDAGQGVQLAQTFDVAEVGLTKDQRIAMMAHEFCHCLGLGHATPGSGNLMEPVLSSIGSPQAWDTAQLLERYPLGATTPTATPTPTPAPPVGATVPGPAASSTILTATADRLDFDVNVGAPGVYLLLVIPLQ